MSRPATTCLLFLYLAGISIVLLAPTPALPALLVSLLADGANGLGTPGALLTPARFEFLVNIAVVVPATAMATALWPRHSWLSWTALGLVFSVVVEGVQGLWMSERSAQLLDVVANTTGALLGAILGTCLLGLRSLQTRSLR